MVLEETSETNSEDIPEKADNLSDTHDDNTRPEPELVEETSEMNSEDIPEKADNISTTHDGKTRIKAEFVDILPTNKSNYFKLVALLVDTACFVIWTYIRENIIGSSSFESFLNLKEKKHKLIHVYEATRCCECVTAFLKGEQLISRKQLLLLYKSDKTKQIQNHTKKVDRKMVQVCICKYVAIENIDVKNIDITLANFIILKCGNPELGLDNWMKQITEVRNEIFHISDIQEITDDKFSRKWGKVEGSLLGIANLINSSFAEVTEKKIHQTKKITCIPEYMLKYEIMCRDYWRNKCAEFERAQIQSFQNKAKALHIQYPKVGNKSLERDEQKTTKDIRNLNTIIDNINILIKVFWKEQDRKTLKDTESVIKDSQTVHVPVFLQLDLPTSWNRTKVLEYLDKMRLNRTSDMNLKIMAVSPDDLNIYSEIARAVLRKEDLLQAEFNTIMSGMHSEAAIDTKQTAAVVVSLTIPEITESVPFKYFQIDVNLRQKFQLQSREYSEIHGTSSTCILTNDQLVFTNNLCNRLEIYEINGSFVGEIKLSNAPRDISVINDNEIAVSYTQGYIETISINTGQVKNKFVTSGNTGGISYQNGLIYLVIDYKKVDVMNLKGEIIRSFHFPLKSTVQSVSTDTDSLFLIYPFNYAVYCCDLNGSEKWIFSFDKTIKPREVTTDQNGYVYVICYQSHNVIVLSPDGKHHTELLTAQNGIKNPTSIYYNKSNDCLLVCNGWNCDTVLFDVKKSCE
ncbi:unnamed protein product [Mytilus coruscus]|uniref:DZIP3-like HEPN domain-containing protein n=1 Tax=Mytilus coruscus TaxID=42192 RepID=A0A6J8CE81_MYTCO|nr:unnamed protein product [Mytilus coruscus]